MPEEEEKIRERFSRWMVDNHNPATFIEWGMMWLAWLACYRQCEQDKDFIARNCNPDDPSNFSNGFSGLLRQMKKFLKASLIFWIFLTLICLGFYWCITHIAGSGAGFIGWTK